MQVPDTDAATLGDSLPEPEELGEPAESRKPPKLADAADSTPLLYNRVHLWQN